MSNTEPTNDDLEKELELIKDEAKEMVEAMTALVQGNGRLRHAEKAEAVESVQATVDDLFYEIITDIKEELERRVETSLMKETMAQVSDLQGRQY